MKYIGTYIILYACKEALCKVLSNSTSGSSITLLEEYDS